MPVSELGVSGGLSGSAVPRVRERVEGERVACGMRTVRSIPELQKAQKLEQVDRIGDETIGLVVANALKARGGSSGAVLARCRTARGNAMSERARGSRAQRREEHLEEQRIPMRGATGGEANSRTDGTRLRTEQSLEVGELGSWQPACG